MIYAKQEGNLYQIRFRYDPDLIALIKNVPGRMWVPEIKMWTIPRDKIGWLMNELKGTKYESQLNIESDEYINVNSTLDATDKIPNIDISNVPFYIKEGATPYKHQLDFMKYAIDRQRKGNMSGFLCADEPGLGKSIEAANLALYNRTQHRFKHCLIICCINSSKYNWKNDIHEHTRGKETPYILGTRLRRNGTERCNTGSKEKYDDLVSGRMYAKKDAPPLPYFLVMNVEGIRYKVGKQYPIADMLISMINSGHLQMIVIDEVHKNVSPTSMQGKQVLRIKKQTGSNVLWVPMTGTPITTKPTDVFLPLRLTDSQPYTSYYMWCKEFCIYGGFGGHEIMGYQNIPRLKSMLQGNMLRRLKQDVIDLPDKVYLTEYVENTPIQQKLYDKLLEEIESKEAEILNSLNPLAAFMRLRQVNGSPEIIDNRIAIDEDYIHKNAKLQWLLDKLEEIHQRNEKVVIFSNWVEPLRTLYKFISKRYKTCCFTGTMSEADREKHKYVFQNNPEYTVLLGTIGAGGTTHTFTAASNVIFYDEPWNATDKEQAIDRTHRIGAKKTIYIYTVLAKDTVDDRVHDILFTKLGISQYIVDNKLDLRKNPRLFDLLLSDSRRKHSNEDHF